MYPGQSYATGEQHFFSSLRSASEKLSVCSKRVVMSASRGGLQLPTFTTMTLPISLVILNRASMLPQVATQSISMGIDSTCGS